MQKEWKENGAERCEMVNPVRREWRSNPGRASGTR